VSPRAARRSPRRPLARGRTRALATALAAAVALGLAACGHEDPPETCRSYPTVLRVDDPGLLSGYPATPLPVTARCAFDVATLTYACRASFIEGEAPGTERVQIRRRTFPSAAAFVAEGARPGQVTARDHVLTSEPDDLGSVGPFHLLPTRPIEGRFTFDALGRPESSDSLRFVEWDAFGRPTRSAPTGVCDTDDGNTYVYDDTRREVLHRWNSRTLTPGPGNTRPCIPRSRRIGFDDAGNAISIDGVPWTTVETASFCTRD